VTELTVAIGVLGSGGVAIPSARITDLAVLRTMSAASSGSSSWMVSTIKANARRAVSFGRRARGSIAVSVCAPHDLGVTERFARPAGNVRSQL